MFKNKKSYIETLVLFIIVMVVKYIFDETSSLGNMYTADSQIFSMVGHSWANDIIPYRDMFDHKGPILFLLHAVAAKINSGIIGIMIVTAINLTIALRLILSISRTFLTNKSNMIHYSIVSLSFIFFLLTHWATGISEELSLVFILLPLLLCTKYLTKTTGGGKLFNPHPYSYSFVYGACFAAIAMIRVNNAPMNVGIVLGFLIIMLKEKQYKELLYNALYCLLGFLAVILPIIAYFNYHDALYEMIYATFIFNWKYRAADVPWFEKSIIQNTMWLIPCFYLMIVTILRDRKSKSIYSYIFIPASIVCICAFISGFSLIHYFMNVLPYFSLSLIFTCELLSEKRMNYSFLIGLLLLVPYYSGIKNNAKGAYYSTIGRNRKAFLHKRSIEEFDTLVSFIPKNEYNSVYLFNAFGCLPYLIKNNIYPTGKYFIGHNMHAAYDDKVMREQNEFHKTTKVKWIISPYTKESSDRESFNVLLQNYELVYTAESTNLYRRKADSI